tara:strand:- start:1378 stop:1569 length:192 start_codon:yes stop_codon:yes gene_type:complete
MRNSSRFLFHSRNQINVRSLSLGGSVACFAIATLVAKWFFAEQTLRAGASWLFIKKPLSTQSH